ncbi:maleylpyruvate isomerase N-terminal domain-containing protein [Asanoa sp. NPDC049573]|uniref:maleylpyruvate isomerase N-terminal domain-containing protein n=1 Tax=Asanoa sp. NPDC049573 TaxID=3155396 RepID=UPI00342445A8
MLAAFRAEAARLASSLGGLADAQWARPTGCPPWNVAGLLGHVVTVIAWVPGMLAAPAPVAASVSAVDYYRAGERFSPPVNAARVALGLSRASGAGSATALLAEFDRTWRSVADLCAAEAPGRVVLTRHGDAMTLTDFLVTRIVEVGIHGLDLAAALDRPPWLTPATAEVLTDLLLDEDADARLAEVGLDRTTFLRKATGRLSFGPGERERLAPRSLALG